MKNKVDFMTIQELHALRAQAIKYLVELPADVRLENMTKNLDLEERRVLSYYHAIIGYAVKVGLLTLEQAQNLEPKYLSTDSDTVEDDYNVL